MVMSTDNLTLFVFTRPNLSVQRRAQINLTGFSTQPSVFFRSEEIVYLIPKLRSVPPSVSVRPEDKLSRLNYICGFHRHPPRRVSVWRIKAVPGGSFPRVLYPLMDLLWAVVYEKQLHVVRPAKSRLPTGTAIRVEMSEKKIRQKELKRRNIIDSIQRIEDFIENYDPNRDINEVAIRMSRLDLLMENFESIQVLRQITTNLPTHTIPSNEWMIPRNINLADPEFHVSKGIELILGAEHFFSFLKGGRIQIGNPSPVLVESVFGWFATGNVNANPNPVVACQTFCFSTIESIASNLEKFWQIEDIDATIPSPNEQICEQFYRETTTRDTTGRYIVKYPKKDNITKLIGESYSHALQRMEGLERRLDKTHELKTNYHNFIAEFIELGHMRKVSTNETIPPVVYYLPHHPVLKDSSTTTKVRSVFDASMKTSTGYALNDALLVGPVVQHELLSLILRFRKYKVALTADIEKMYRQISIHPDDRPLQRLLWRFNKDDPISEYELTTVTYGLSSSSFLATRTLHQLAEDEGELFTLAARALKRDFYVDDFIRGEDSIENAIKLREQMDDLLKHGGFTLRKWCSNHPEVVDGIPEENLATQSCQTFDSKEMIKTLGICWDPKSDQFQFDIDPSVNNEPITKRKILSSIARLYDPLGLIAPILVRAKILLQQLWAISLCWDEEVPLEIRKKWRRLIEEFPNLTNFRIDRYAFMPGKVQLHCFADASELAYGACVYARSEAMDGSIRIELLMSKSRVAPLKKRSIPRLELCAAQIAAHLFTKVKAALDMEFSSIHFWSDSMVVLHWLRSPSQNWRTFIANRVADIQMLTHHGSWKHVPGASNPADLLSRSMTVEQLLTSDLWKRGPYWLRKGEDDWPKNDINIEASDEELERKTHSLVILLSHQIH
ncbi:uncharacterized protein LOC129774553 [Toxorhynchites rutilus septentrionalis]|uniref:uncharacterized protein LOC129774553 n=1 Tax=Toxorhynchites rutilus septentrionalis TaxID=329112 RepID=UPI002479BB57|nr:uncharacterized protein LOC129774553 [Toxorhynchites rutilus septentrionalis]